MAEEDRKARVDRELGELLEEVRVAIPGAEVLFAFLLTAAFSQRFADLDALGERVYAVALLLAALAAVTLMGPAAFHRMSQRGKRATRVHVSAYLQVIGMFLLLVSIVLVTFVVIRLVFDDTFLGALFAGTVAVVGVGIWYVLPRVARLNVE